MVLCLLFEFPIPGSGSQGFRHGHQSPDPEIGVTNLRIRRLVTMLGKAAETLLQADFCVCGSFEAYKCLTSVARGRY